VPTLHSLTLEQWIERYRMLREKSRTLYKGGLNEKQPVKPAASNAETEHPDGCREQDSDGEHKRRRVGAKKSERREGKKRSRR